MVRKGSINRLRRVCLYGGSGVGKSTLAAWLFAELKVAGCNVEHVTERIKEWAYLGRKKKSFDEVLLFGEQLHREDFFLQHGVDFVVTDSPIFLQTFYSDLIGHCTVPGQIQMAWEFEQEYPSFNILLDRTGIPFSSKGRYESTVGEAIELDTRLECFLDRVGLPFVKLAALDRDSLFDRVLRACRNPQAPHLPPAAYNKWLKECPWQSETPAFKTACRD
jgi:predicted ATPase